MASEKLIRLYNEYPEVLVWAFVWTCCHIVLMLKMWFWPKKVVVTEEVAYPYVPNDMLVKIINMLRNEEVHWDICRDGLRFGKLILINSQWTGVSIHYAGASSATNDHVDLDMSKIVTNTQENILLREVFRTRYNKIRADEEVRRKKTEEETRRRAEQEVIVMLTGKDTRNIAAYL
jgi:hypothetical protein